MKTVKIKTKPEPQESVVICRGNVLKETLPALLEGQCALIFTDENVLRLYGNKLKKYLPDVPVHAMPAGEENKNENTLFALLQAMANEGLHRNSMLVALGGGVVGDIGGLAASLYMRGISVVQVPTTLLAQVDSSVGGKTAIDFCGVKNLVGAFKQPEKVLADPAFFKTLPAREIRCGLGEIIKHGALDSEFFDLLWAHREKLTDLKFLADIVPKNIAYKASVVRKDPQEKGLRKCLNLGHTTAHAIELAGADLSHGECVLVGTIYEARLARRYLDCDGEYLNCLEQLCCSVLACDLKTIDVAGAANLARLDKKNTSSEKIVMTVPVKRGEYALLELPYAEYAQALTQIREGLC